MGRLIDAEPFDFNKVIIPDGGANFMRGYGLGAKHVCDEIDAAPTVDAVPVIRCTACKHWDQCSGLTARMCYQWRRHTKQFDYCSYGEARA